MDTTCLGRMIFEVFRGLPEEKSAEFQKEVGRWGALLHETTNEADEVGRRTLPLVTTQIL